jgi:hypothetical protein
LLLKEVNEKRNDEYTLKENKFEKKGRSSCTTLVLQQERETSCNLQITCLPSKHQEAVSVV